MNGGLFTLDVVLLQSDDLPIFTACIPLLEQFLWDLFDHPPCSPSPRHGYCLFRSPREWKTGPGPTHFHTDEDVMDGTNGWLGLQAVKSQAANAEVRAAL